MQLSMQMINLSQMRRVVILISLAFVLSGGFTHANVLAQTSDSWSEPINLSKSGSAGDPELVVDADGIFHAIWIDEFAGLVYTTGDGAAWSVPIPVDLPFGDTKPELVADNNGYIHAFWRDENGSLLYGRARANAFSSPSSWTVRAQLAESVLDMDIIKDDLGNLHLSYVRPIESADFPAGIYYRELGNGTSTWLSPVLLYESPYFRSLSMEDSNVDLSSSLIEDQVNVYVAWDNFPRERVFFARSEDGGRTWSLPYEVDKPDSGVGNVGSSKIVVDADGNDVLLIWQANHSESNCDQYYQFSRDSGATWSARQKMLEGYLICPEDNQVLSIESGSLLLMNGIEVFLQAWNGESWSDPQFQQSLTTFVDPDTERFVEFGCQQATVVSGTRLYVIGCDDDVGKDIWLLNRQLLDIESWYPQEAVWSPGSSVNNSESRNSTPVLISDSQGRMHALWSQADSMEPEGLGRSIYYARWEDGQWSRPEEVINPSGGMVEQPAAAIGDQDQLYLTWSGGEDGEIYFSTAEAGQAVVPTSWSEPVKLPSPSSAGSASSIVVDDQGEVYVSYAVPLNEARGIYLVSSQDGGQTWSQPKMVFNAEAAGWSMVENPRLAVTAPQNLHILWTRSTLPNGQGALSLLYSKSEDGGETWLDPREVVENPVAWSQIVGIGEQTVQRVWQETGTSGTTLWHEESLDNGESWFRTVPVSVFGDTVGLPGLTSDNAGRLHLLLSVRNEPENIIVQHWLYDLGRWSAERNLELNFSTNADLDSVVGTISDSGNLGILVSDVLYSIEADNDQHQLIFFNRQLEVPLVVVNPTQPAPTEPQLTVEPTSTKPVQTSTPIQELATNAPGNLLVDSNPPVRTSWISIAGPLFIVLIVGAVIVIVFRGIRNWR